MIRIGILGDIGSGKSYVAKNFGYPVFNADKEVGKLYKKNRKVFNKLQKDKEIIKDEKILFIGLDKNKKSHQDLFNQLSLGNIVKIDLDENELKATIDKNGYQDYDHEISAIISWVKEKLSKKQTKLLIMSPALDKFQIKLQNEIDRNIQPIIFQEMRSESITNSSHTR